MSDNELNLSPYRKEAKCEKCGSNCIKSRYERAVREIDYLINQWVIVMPEHIVRTCCICGYYWWEASLDAESSKPSV